jgi:orotate phosphoribosyltransferase
MKKNIAKILLDKKAVTLNIKEPYTYASGIRSPMYCDNRVLTYFPVERDIVVQGYVDLIKENHPDVEIIAGTATGAISWAAWVAEKMNLPMVYIKKSGKGYGQDNLIEGGSIDDKKTVVIEDTVSTGGSSMNAVQCARKSGGNILSMIAIYTYEFEKAKNNFEEGNCKALFLTNFSSLVKVAAKNNFIEADNIELIKEWNKDPTGWGPKNGFELGEKKN